ncbi:MAG: AEC family transporter, partial [Anaerolineaceae bacterium]|nr:AEC family transporter [Anaerolineaceae bacterium]
MSVFSASLNVIIPIFAAIGLGVLFGKVTKVSGRAISQAVVYLFAPALVLRELSRTEIHPEALGSIFAMAVLSSAGLLLAGWIISRLMKLPHPQESTLMLGVTLGNTGSIGLPLAQFAFGDVGLQYAAVFYVCTAIFANILGVYLPSRGKFSIKESIVRIFQVPMIYAAVLGLGINLLNIPLPTPVDRVFSLLGQG